jgi:hypothetical protein
VGDPTPYVQNFNGSPEELATFLGTLRDPEGGTRMYHFRIGDFTLLLGDSAGPIFEYPEIRASLNRFPDCVDVMANAILGFDQPVSGLQDPVAFVANAHPRLFIPTHADAWAPALSAGQAAFKDELATELAALPNPPQIDHLIDPQDYLKERAYRVDDPKWVEPMAGSSCARRAAAQQGGRIRLRVRPARVRVGRRRRFAFRALVDGHSVEGATVRFAGRTARTDRRGRARIPRSLRSPRLYRARASKRGLRSGTARVRGVRSRRGPRFTG